MTVGEKYELLGGEFDTDSEGGVRFQGAELAKMLPGVVIVTCFDPGSGERVFSNDDLDWLQGQPATIIETVANAGLRVSGVTDEAVEEGKEGSS